MTLRTISPAAARRLNEMLGGTHAELLPQWLEMAAELQLVVPSDMLPALLAYAERSASPPESLLDVIGPYGDWLAAHAPIWEFMTLRRQNPAAALARLEAGDFGEDPAALAGRLAVGLGPADEVFLEAAAVDPRKELREAALDLLTRLPGSRLARRMRERALEMVVFRGGQLRVEPPAACDPELEAAGVAPAPPRGTGERAWWLSQVMGMVPPDAWPVEAVDAAAATDWEAAVLGGWARGAMRFPTRRWVEALTLLWERTPEVRQHILGYGLTRLVARLAPDECDGFLLGVFQRSPEWAAHLAILCTHRWGHELSEAFAGSLPWLATKPDLEMIQALRMFGYRGDPSVEPEIARVAEIPWSVPPVVSAFAEVLEVLRWRAAMAAELAEAPA